jgi:phosphoglucosamine mutase
VDAGNGAAYKSTPWILRELGATCSIFHDKPDGRNINANCGSTYPNEIARLVRETGAHIGISHDGDADRVQLCDEKGEVVDGDDILAIAAVDHLRRGALAKDTLVATVMSNFGLDETLAEHKGRVLRTKVGDRHVIEAMLRDELNVGGEQSGHMIFRDYSTTGDGIVSALQILRIMAESGKPLSELKQCLRKYPQAQRNLKVREKIPIDQMPDVTALVAEAEKILGGAGRVLLRYSGTEPKIRLLIEGRDSVVIEAHADRIAGVLQERIGA